MLAPLQCCEHRAPVRAPPSSCEVGNFWGNNLRKGKENKVVDLQLGRRQGLQAWPHPENSFVDFYREVRSWELLWEADQAPWVRVSTIIKDNSDHNKVSSTDSTLSTAEPSACREASCAVWGRSNGKGFAKSTVQA